MRTLIAATLVLAAGGCTTEETLGNTLDAPDAGPVIPPAPVFGATRWAISVGAIDKLDYAHAIGFAPGGDVIVAGSSLGPIDLGSGPLPAGSYGVGFVTRRAAADGAEVWTVPIVGYSGGVSDLTVDGDGSVVVVGEYGGTTDFGGQTLQTQAGMHGDMFIAKYTGNGQLLWVRGLGPESDAQVDSVVVSSGGMIVASGQFRGVVDFGDGPVVASDGDAFLLAFDASGTPLWNVITHDAKEWNDEVAFAPDGDLVVLGGVMGGDAYRSEVIERRHADGSLISRWILGPAGEKARSWGSTLLVDADGRIIVTDHQETDYDDCEEVLTTRALDASGTELWAAHPVSGSAAPQTAALTPGGAVVTAGGLQSFDADFGTGILNGAYLVAYDSSGTPADGLSFGNPAPVLDLVLAVAAADDGAIAFSAQYDGTIDLGTGPLAPLGDQIVIVDQDLVIAVLDPPAP